MSRVLKTNGSLFLEINTYSYFFYLYRLIREIFHFRVDIEHPHSFTLNKIKKMLFLDFKIIKIRKIRELKRIKTFYFYCIKK